MGADGTCSLMAPWWIGAQCTVPTRPSLAGTAPGAPGVRGSGGEPSQHPAGSVGSTVRTGLGPSSQTPASWACLPCIQPKPWAQPEREQHGATARGNRPISPGWLNRPSPDSSCCPFGHLAPRDSSALWPCSGWPGKGILRGHSSSPGKGSPGWEPGTKLRDCGADRATPTLPALLRAPYFAPCPLLSLKLPEIPYPHSPTPRDALTGLLYPPWPSPLGILTPACSLFSPGSQPHSRGGSPEEG